MAQAWGFYGRHEEQKQLSEILKRKRWFFIKISGRRRIGKTDLVNQVVRKIVPEDRLLYMQIPDSDAAGVLSEVREFFALFKIRRNPPTDLRDLARALSDLIREGYVVVIDEFQYFHRQALYEFTSFLQYEVDRLSAEADTIRGGLIVLGSLHTEMVAILEDRSAPLYNRITNAVDLPHLDIASVLEILRNHADADPERLLFLWNLFEGVPKFYRDCYEQEVLSASRKELIERMFFSSAAPLKSEADNWFLRELRGRTDLVLKYAAQHPGCTSGEIKSQFGNVGAGTDKQVESYIRILLDRYEMLERLQPITALRGARRGRIYVKDNFLRSWLHALAVPAASVNFKPLEMLVEEADRRLQEAEGHGFERLVWTLYSERSRKGLGDFPLTERIQGYWDRAGTELDLVALNQDDRVIRFGSCKRNAGKLIADLDAFDGHVRRFMERVPNYTDWKVEKAAITPRHTPETRKAAEGKGYIPQDLIDLTEGL